MDAGQFVGRHGADLVRLWDSSIDYTADVPFSEEMFTRLGDTYRRIRNTLRILIGNLDDFPAVAGIDDPGQPASPTPATTLIDRWILERLNEVIHDCRSAYEKFEFHKVYHTLNQFCAVDLSSLYIDITKDWLYCDASDSQRRRATQTVMHRIFDTLCRLLAPILAFTAEEAWIQSGSGGSVHLQEFFAGGELDHGAESLFNEALYVRKMLGPHIEQQRSQDVIGTSQEASILVAYADTDELLADWWLSQTELLAQILIVSEVRLAKRKSLEIAVRKTAHRRCARCWRHRPAVGTSKAYPELCDRCESVITNKIRVARQITE